MEDKYLKPVPLFSKGTFSFESVTMPYRLFTPKMEPKKKYPLVFFLHGGGERGEDNEKQLTACLGPTVFAGEDFQKENPCFVLAPQCPGDTVWSSDPVDRGLLALLDTVVRECPVDLDRIYLTGLSMGGVGSLHLMNLAPWKFAGVLTCAAAGNPYAMTNTHTPLWAFHAADDPVVPVNSKLAKRNADSPFWMGSRAMVAALRIAGNRFVRYTEYPAGYMEKAYGVHPHGSWEGAYRDKEALTWLFSQNRKDQYEVNMVVPGVYHIEDATASSFYLVEGKDKALLIDTGMGEGDIKALVEGITSLPVTLAVTHAHGDHMKHAASFMPFYISHKEGTAYDRFVEMMMPDFKIPLSDTLDMENGFVFDLGGGYEIEVIDLGGHTPGSVVFFDRKRRIFFTGDALGSGEGVWMQVPLSLPVSQYKENLKAFLERITREDARGAIFLGGHRSQQGSAKEERFNPLSATLVEDMITLCDQLLEGSCPLTPYPSGGNFTDEYVVKGEYQAAAICIIPSQIR